LGWVVNYYVVDEVINFDLLVDIEGGFSDWNVIGAVITGD